MMRYLVVAHRTLVGPHLLAEAGRRIAAGPSEFHLLVPVQHPRSGWSDGEVEAEARVRLKEGLSRFRELGAPVDGEIGDANPVLAIGDLLRARREGDVAFDEILLSTLPPGLSRWLHLDVVSRAREEHGLPVTHVVAEREPSR